MFLDDNIDGSNLPHKTLCLTYDDGPGESPGIGPGPRTSQLGDFLFEQGIGATFFVVGKHAEAHASTAQRLLEWGHLIGNHTYSHPGLVDLTLAGGDPVEELERTHDIIAEYVDGSPLLFRPPYGSWRERTRPGGPEDKASSIVAERLNRSAKLAAYLGPIMWDIAAEDWHAWRREEPPEVCARRYLDEIERVGRGVVLMHDSSEEDDVRPKNRTLELTMHLVPELRSRGYRFVRADELPQVQSEQTKARTAYARH